MQQRLEEMLRLAFGLALLRGLFDVDPLPALEAVQRLLPAGKEKIR